MLRKSSNVTGVTLSLQRIWFLYFKVQYDCYKTHCSTQRHAGNWLALPLHVVWLSSPYTLFQPGEEGGRGVEESGLALHLANGAMTPCHAHPWRIYRNILTFSLFPVICIDWNNWSTLIVFPLHPRIPLMKQDMRLLHCQCSFNSQNRYWWGTHTVKEVFMCIKK
jgi:hypothetical protein